jgi:hypothetical protein
VSDYLKAVKEAAELASYNMTARLRKSAYENGWSSDLTHNTVVTYTQEEGFGVVFDESVRQSAMDMEYGTEEIRPTAAIRKYQNSSHAEQSFMRHLKAKTKGLL